MEPDVFAETGRRVGPTPLQAIAAGLVLVAVSLVVWALRQPPRGDLVEVELLAGTVLGPADLALMEAVFDRADLADHRIEDGRLFVAGGRQSGYLRALVDAGALPPEFGGSLRRAVENDSPWQSQASRAEQLRVATQEELSLVIRTMPGIKQAAVLYDHDAGDHLFRGTAEATQTASVSVRMEPGTRLDPHRVQAIRVLVASSIAGLRAERVAVTDLSSGQVYDGPLVSEADLIAGDPARARAVAYERHVLAKLRQALSFITGVVVEVNASVGTAAPPRADGPTTPSHPRAAANAPAAITPPALPDSPLPPGGQTVQVSLAIPEAYLAGGRRRPAAAEEPPEESIAGELQRLEQLVVGLVPISPPWSRVQVTITQYPGRGTAGLLPVPPVQPPVAGSTAAASAAVTAESSTPRELVAAALTSLPDVPRQSFLLAACLGIAVLGGGGLLLGRQRLSPPGSGTRRGAIDWSTLARRPALNRSEEAV